MRGAGGSEGGTLTFFIGLAMMIAGGYLLLSNIVIRPVFGFRTAAFNIGGFGITTGMILIPFIFGVGLVFYNSSSKFGWGLAIGSVIALVAGVIANLNIQFAALSIFDLLVILILLFGGLGLFLRSLRG
ncbi:hypothetical protein SAMN05444003_0259 [Cognatiyoonia sediminum]|uniref:Uncharacterized protein n=1 Tax=Cognatiyoonia sediminum TaxID=1508389 RepID=A0A1M5LH50_9RHOB|nr:hypothetical protein [Cognatiyoonia sediminum]SHG63693.1 hypothetical protein SAMN05444003_0259 [Cognatiyoonia sediminum]